MSRPWMPLYVADYLRDTRRLTAAEHGAYLLLIMEYWTSGSLPDDDRQLSRITCMTPAEWRRARPNVQPFFTDGWKHKRIDAELARSAEISSKRSASAKQKHSNRSANAEQLDTHAGATSQPQPQQDAAPAAPDPEVELFRRGREVLGKTGGGLISKLLVAKQKNVALARAAIEQASTKSDPREYIGAIVRGKQAADQPQWLDGIEGVI
jgi:uncharacterized protein YdaU (DUF1376 family)